MSVPLVRVEPAARCRIVGRLNRFVVRVSLDGVLRDVHINNTGKLVDVLVPGREGLCIETRTGRLGLRLFSVWYNGGFAVLDTNLQEKAFALAVDKGLIPWLRGCRVASRSPRVGRHRLDLELDCPMGRVLVETKSAVLVDNGGLALYPDTVSLRGREHVRLLSSLADKGYNVALVFIAAFPGARGFRPYEGGDPEMPGLVAEAFKRGVIVRSVGLEYSVGSRAVSMYNPDLPVIIPGVGVIGGEGSLHC